MIDLHFQDFDDVKGQTPIERYETLLGRSPTRSIIKMEKSNGVFCEYNLAKRTFFTKHNKPWREGFFPARFHEEGATLADKCSNKVGSQINIWGELFIPDIPLATIAGAISVNRKEISAEYLPRLQYHIFDIYNPFELAINFPFWLRAEVLHNAFKALDFDDREFIRQVPATRMEIAAALAAEFHYQTTVRPNFEGEVYYIGRATQLPGISYEIVKRTVTHTAEFDCVGIKLGDRYTKREGRISTLILVNDEGQEFSVGGGDGLTNELLEQFAGRPPIGCPITVAFKEYSRYGLPLRPKYIAVRNYE